MDVRGVISSDIVSSTSLSIEDIANFKNKVVRFFDEVRAISKIDFWGRIVKGDEIEIVSNSPKDIFRLAFLLKCHIKSYELLYEAERRFKKYGVRLSLGIGSLRINDPVNDIIDGEAIYFSGRGLTEISKQKRSLIIFQSGNKEKDECINAICSLIDTIINNATSKQCEILYHKLLNISEQDIARKLNLTQPTVNSASSAVSWSVLNNALLFLEKQF